MLETQPKIIDAYVKPGRVKLIWHPLLDFGEPSLFASQAAECAGDQGKFWPMHHLIFQRQDQVWTAKVDLFKNWARQDLGLDAEAFGACLSSGKYKSKIEGQYAAAKASGVRIRPTFDINGKRIQGAVDFATFQKVIDSIQ